MVVPGAWAGKKLIVMTAATSDLVDLDRLRAPEKYAPRSIDQLVHLVETVPNDAEITMRILSKTAGSTVDGIEVPTLPRSITVTADAAP